jgi:hypothetical protein
MSKIDISDCEQRCSVGEQINKIGEQKQKSPIETSDDGKSIINQPAMNNLCTYVLMMFNYNLFITVQPIVILYVHANR